MKKVIALLALLIVAVCAQDTFTDPKDGKKYKYVKIGNQTWMAENLNYNTKDSKCYGEGGKVDVSVGDDRTVEKTLSAAEVQANCAKYGRLYSWNDAMKACPEGWHLSTTEEWDNLRDFVGGRNVAGKELKAESEVKKSDLNDPKCKWTEEKIDNRGRVTFIEHNKCPKYYYGFSALLGGSGYSRSGVSFGGIGGVGIWWASFEHSDYAYFYRMYNSEESMDTENGVNASRSSLFSVRCVQGQKPKTCCRYCNPSMQNCDESGNGNNCVEWCTEPASDSRGSATEGSSSKASNEKIQPPKGQNSSGSFKASSASDTDIGSGDAPRSKAEIMQVVNARRPGLNNMYKKYLIFKPGFSGNVTFKFTIAPGGDIIKIGIVSSTTGYAEFDAAVKNMITATWKWKAIKGGNTTTTVPLDFK